MSFKEYIETSKKTDCKISEFFKGMDFCIKISKNKIKLFSKQIGEYSTSSNITKYLEFYIFDNSQDFIEFLFMLRDAPKEQRQDLEKNFLIYQNLNQKGYL